MGDCLRRDNRIPHWPKFVRASEARRKLHTIARDLEKDSWKGPILRHASLRERPPDWSGAPA